MSATLKAAPEILRLQAVTAADLMAPNPISLRAEATIEEAMALFADKAITAAPVIDAVGRPIGVVSRSDLFIHQVEATRRPESLGTTEAGPTAHAASAGQDRTRVADVMTPAVFAVSPAAPVSRVVSDMIGLHVHRLFVVDDDGVLVGAITSMDVLKRLQPV